MEDGEYGLLPGPAYVTGFLRNYAAYLGLQSDDLVQEFYAYRAPPAPTVRPATRVLASVHERQLRKRFLWLFGAVALLLAGAFAIKQYNDAYGHGYAAPLMTPQNLGATTAGVHKAAVSTPTTVRLHLRSISPVWVRITADGGRVYQGLLRHVGRTWTAHHSIYVMTYDGTRVRATVNGHALGRIGAQAGLGVWSATTTGWHHIS